jgi:hypothetical protein
MATHTVAPRAKAMRSGGAHPAAPQGHDHGAEPINRKGTCAAVIEAAVALPDAVPYGEELDVVGVALRPDVGRVEPGEGALLNRVAGLGHVVPDRVPRPRAVVPAHEHHGARGQHRRHRREHRDLPLPQRVAGQPGKGPEVAQREVAQRPRAPEAAQRQRRHRREERRGEHPQRPAAPTPPRCPSRAARRARAPSRWQRPPPPDRACPGRGTPPPPLRSSPLRTGRSPSTRRSSPCAWTR